MGRLTPCIFKVLLSAKESRIEREISAPLSGLLAVVVASPHPRPRPVRDHDRSLSVSAHNPRS